MFRDAVVDIVASPFVRLTAAARAAVNAGTEMWALRDVSFDIQPGEVVGVIGRNGAGKSTLLKILTQITYPTEGQVEIFGKVASLLEVGTGFHPELTGRENIFLNGAILGMKRTEIVRKFDEIVAFAEVDRFIDTPVKRYSSGMYVRLAFAVAAHLDPDILLVDEVLSVGDVAFQKKCLGKIGQVSRTEGRTVLLVSHNMTAIQSLCQRAILLDGGRVCCDAPAEECLHVYLAQNPDGRSASWERPAGAHTTSLEICRVALRLEGRQPQHALVVAIDLRSMAVHQPAFIAVEVLDENEIVLMQTLPRLDPFIDDALPRHHVEVRMELPPFIPGVYTTTVWVGTHFTRTLDEAKCCARFEISGSPTKGRSFPHAPSHGRIVPASSETHESFGEA